MIYRLPAIPQAKDAQKEFEKLYASTPAGLEIRIFSRLAKEVLRRRMNWHDDLPNATLDVILARYPSLKTISPYKNRRRAYSEKTLEQAKVLADFCEQDHCLTFAEAIELVLESEIPEVS